MNYTDKSSSTYFQQDVSRKYHLIDGLAVVYEDRSMAGNDWTVRGGVLATQIGVC